jgi:DNA polymerase-3 subunit beta
MIRNVEAKDMEFTVFKADLVRELAVLERAVEKKNTIPILANVLIEADQDLITLTATDLELAVQCSCPAGVLNPGVQYAASKAPAGVQKGGVGFSKPTSFRGGM